MLPLVNGEPAEGESWEELAEHSITHDNLIPGLTGNRLILTAHDGTDEDSRFDSAQVHATINTNPAGVILSECRTDNRSSDLP